MMRLVWIFGSSRSGSTWLLRMLSEVDGVVPIDDPHLGHHLGVWRPIPLAWAASPEPPDLTTLLEVKKDQPGYFFSERYRDQWWEPLKKLIEARFEAQSADHLNCFRGEPACVVKEPGSHVAGLLTDLRGDAGMSWVPESAWLTELRVNSSVSDLRYDLAIDATGRSTPSYTAAGLAEPTLPIDSPQAAGLLLLLSSPLLLFAFLRST